MKPRRVFRQTSALVDLFAFIMAGVGLALLLVALLGMGGCATAPPKPDPGPKEVLVPVVKPCVSADVPGKPAGYADDDPGADPVERMTRTAAANQQRKARLAILEPVVAVCRGS